MGVYAFESKHGPFVKVGHYKGENAWRRIAPQRGFYSTESPQELSQRIGPNDFELRLWFPTLGTRDEQIIHKQLKDIRVIGEWYSTEALLRIVSLISTESRHQDCDFTQAMNFRPELSIRERIALRKAREPNNPLT
jgi:hypothetical protein